VDDASFLCDLECPLSCRLARFVHLLFLILLVQVLLVGSLLFLGFLLLFAGGELNCRLPLSVYYSLFEFKAALYHGWNVHNK